MTVHSYILQGAGIMLHSLDMTQSNRSVAWHTHIEFILWLRVAMIYIYFKIFIIVNKVGFFQIQSLTSQLAIYSYVHSFCSYVYLHTCIDIYVLLYQKFIIHTHVYLTSYVYVATAMHAGVQQNYMYFLHVATCQLRSQL